MVFLSKFTLVAALSALFGIAAGQNDFQIYQPSANWWWVAESQNTMSWDCKNSPASQFTVLIMNTNPSVLSGRLAFIAQQDNTDCSKLIDKTQINQTPATGYILQFADVLNSSNIYAQSDQFEIKALGSTYPTSTPAGASSTGSSSATASAGLSSSSSSSKSNDASSIKTSMGFGLVAIGAVLGFMTA
jgi:hypothetical protein